MLLLPCLPPVVQRGGGTGLSIEFNERRAGVATSADAAVAQWFSQDLFQDDNVEDEEADAAAVLEQRQQQQHKQQPKKQQRGGAGGDPQPPLAAAAQQLGEEGKEESGGDSSGSDAEAEPGTAAARKRQRGGGAGAAGTANGSTGGSFFGLSKDALAGPEDGFEEVPAQESGSDGSESEDEFETLDDSAKVGGG